MSERPLPVRTWVTRCARCGEDHYIGFKKFTEPSGEFTYYGECENTGEPVLMRYVQETRMERT